MAGVAGSLNTTFLAIGISVIGVVFSIFIYFKFFCSRRGRESPAKSSQKKAKKTEKKSGQPANKTSKSSAKSQSLPQKVATPKLKEIEPSKEQVLATTDEEDWVNVKPTKAPHTQAAKPTKSLKQENQPKKNQQQQQGKKAEKAVKKNNKVERKSSSDGSPAPSYLIPPQIEKPVEEEWQEITPKKKRPRARKE